jgi:hypothetical protein
MDAVRAIAHYILALEHAARATAHAEDRPTYTALLADAAPLLAVALGGEAAQDLPTRLQQHEKLWGSSWLRDPVFQEASAAWQAAKAACSHACV